MSFAAQYEFLASGLSTPSNETGHIAGVAYKVFKNAIGETSEKMIIGEGTPEGIMNSIGNEPKPFYAIQSTEFGEVLKRLKQRD